MTGRRWVRTRFFWLGRSTQVVPIFPGQRYVLERLGLGFWTRLDWRLEDAA